MLVHSPNCWVTVGRDPHAGKVVGVYFVLEELSPPVLMHVDAARLAVVDLTSHHCGISTGFHLKASDAIVVYIVGLKVTL